MLRYVPTSPKGMEDEGIDNVTPYESNFPMIQYDFVPLTYISLIYNYKSTINMIYL